MYFTSKKVKNLAVVVLLALVAVFGVQAALQNSYSAEVQPQSMMGDQPAPCPYC